MQLFTGLFLQVDVQNSAVRYQTFGIFHNLMNMIAADDWKQLFEVFNTAVVASGKVENYQFTMLPNPSTVARILDRFETTGSPWTSMDQHKDCINSTMREVLEQLQSQCPQISDRVEDSLLDRNIPDIDPFISHYSPSTVETVEVINGEEKLSFAMDISEELEMMSPRKNRSANVVYATPPKPIVVAEPSTEIPSSPMVLRKQQTLFSPRGNSSKKKRFIK